MSLVLVGLAVLLLAGSCAATLFALNEERPDPTWWDGWTKRLLAAGGAAFLLFHVEACVRAFSGSEWTSSAPGFGIVPMFLLDGAWLAWASLTIVLGCLVARCSWWGGGVGLRGCGGGARPGHRHAAAWFAALLLLGVMAVAWRSASRTLFPPPPPPIGLGVCGFGWSGPDVFWEHSFLTWTGILLVPAAAGIIVGGFSRFPWIAARVRGVPGPEAPWLRAACACSVSLSVLHLVGILLDEWVFSVPPPLFSIQAGGLFPAGIPAALLAWIGLGVLTLGWGVETEVGPGSGLDPS